MDIEVFENGFSSNLKKNFNQYSCYYDYKHKVFDELQTSHFEITHCLVLEFYKAAITLTNYFLERLLKLALIKNEVGIGSTPIENLNSVYTTVDKKYGKMSLGNTIKECRINNIIDENEKLFLDKQIREMVRNGFSHADPKQILKNAPEKAPFFHGSLKNPTQLTQLDLNIKEIPFIQSVAIDEFSKRFAPIYFQSVFTILRNIEYRLVQKNSK